MQQNRKLLVSVFDPQEAREAVLGGGRIIDSEDPSSALGNIKPRQIMRISDAVLSYKRDLEVQLSTNIGEDQLLFDRSELGTAIQKSPYEMAGKAAQSAIGVATAMGTRCNEVNITKVGVDGMPVDLVRDVLAEVVATLKATENLSHCQVMSVLFAQDMDLWDERKTHPDVIRTLVQLREFHAVDHMRNEDAFDLRDYAVGTLRDEEGNYLYEDQAEVTLESLQEHGVLPDSAGSTYVQLNELFPHSRYFPSIASGSKRTSKEVIKAMVDASADAGADSIMLDTRIQSKVARICLVDTASSGMVDLNRFDERNGLPRKGILTLDEIRFFVDYCHYKGIEANVAGSVQSYQAQQLWAAIPELDQVSTRGASSGVRRNPYEEGDAGNDTRQDRVIRRTLVRGLTAPEHGGVMNVPESFRRNATAMAGVATARERINAARRAAGLDDVEVFSVNSFGDQTPLDEVR